MIIGVTVVVPISDGADESPTMHGLARCGAWTCVSEAFDGVEGWCTRAHCLLK